MVHPIGSALPGSALPDASTKFYIQVNIYGRRLEEVKNSGINILSLLKSVGLSDCVMAELPMSRNRKDRPSLSSTIPDRNQSVSSVSQPSDEFGTSMTEIRCSSASDLPDTSGVTSSDFSSIEDNSSFQVKSEPDSTNQDVSYLTPISKTARSATREAQEVRERNPVRTSHWCLPPTTSILFSDVKIENEEIQSRLEGNELMNCTISTIHPVDNSRATGASAPAVLRHETVNSANLDFVPINSTRVVKEENASSAALKEGEARAEETRFPDSRGQENRLHEISMNVENSKASTSGTVSRVEAAASNCSGTTTVNQEMSTHKEEEVAEEHEMILIPQRAVVNPESLEIPESPGTAENQENPDESFLSALSRPFDDDDGACNFSFDFHADMEGVTPGHHSMGEAGVEKTEYCTNTPLVRRNMSRTDSSTMGEEEGFTPSNLVDQKERNYPLRSCRRRLSAVSHLNSATASKTAKKEHRERYFKCCHEDCSLGILWRPRYGRTRFLDHVRCHWKKARKQCKLCDFRGVGLRNVRYHHKKHHPDLEWQGCLSTETNEDLENFLGKWRQCFPEISIQYKRRPNVRSRKYGETRSNEL